MESLTDYYMTKNAFYGAAIKALGAGAKASSKALGKGQLARAGSAAKGGAKRAWKTLTPKQRLGTAAGGAGRHPLAHFTVHLSIHWRERLNRDQLGMSGGSPSQNGTGIACASAGQHKSGQRPDACKQHKQNYPFAQKGTQKG